MHSEKSDMEFIAALSSVAFNLYIFKNNLTQNFDIWLSELHASK